MGIVADNGFAPLALVPDAHDQGPAERPCGECCRPASAVIVVSTGTEREDIAVWRCEDHVWSVAEFAAVEQTLRDSGLSPLIVVQAA